MSLYDAKSPAAFTAGPAQRNGWSEVAYRTQTVSMGRSSEPGPGSPATVSSVKLPVDGSQNVAASVTVPVAGAPAVAAVGGTAAPSRTMEPPSAVGKQGRVVLVEQQA